MLTHITTYRFENNIFLDNLNHHHWFKQLNCEMLMNAALLLNKTVQEITVNKLKTKKYILKMNLVIVTNACLKIIDVAKVLCGRNRKESGIIFKTVVNLLMCSSDTLKMSPHLMIVINLEYFCFYG